jgi:hypothetical protein
LANVACASAADATPETDRKALSARALIPTTRNLVSVIRRDPFPSPAEVLPAAFSLFPLTPVCQQARNAWVRPVPTTSGCLHDAVRDSKFQISGSLYWRQPRQVRNRVRHPNHKHGKSGPAAPWPSPAGRCLTIWIGQMEPDIRSRDTASYPRQGREHELDGYSCLRTGHSYQRNPTDVWQENKRSRKTYSDSHTSLKMESADRGWPSQFRGHLRDLPARAAARTTTQTSRRPFRAIDCLASPVSVQSSRLTRLTNP